MNNLEFRRQYIASDCDFEPLPGWPKIRCSDRLYVSHHPDLEVCHATSEWGGILVIGYLIDPYAPKLLTSDIVYKLVGECLDFDDLLKRTFCLSGRFAIIYWDPEITRVFHDPCALRKVYYSLDGDGLFLASQPALLKKYVDLAEDDSPGLKQLFQSDEFSKNESMWVGDGTIYKSVKQLMPNFYLDLVSREVHRYWPQEFASLDISSVVKEVATILKGSVDAMTRRGEVMQSVTAGWDSRVLLAASKEVKEKIYYFVNTMNVLKDDHMDLAIPKKMLGDLGLTLNVHGNMPALRDEFYRDLRHNVEGARQLPKTVAIQYYHDFCSDKINLNGNGSEIARSFYGVGHNDLSITSEKVLTLSGYRSQSDNPYLVKAIKDWLVDARAVAEESKVPIMDLFYWEQRMGNWGGAFISEQDIAVEGFMPFNNRKLLMLTLGVEQKYRCAPDYILHRKLIEHMWPELLKYPINPETFKEKLRKIVKSFISEKQKSRVKGLLAKKTVQ